MLNTWEANTAVTFRGWINKIYAEYCLELEHENIPAPSRLELREYFNRYKWWLRQQYRKSKQSV